MIELFYYAKSTCSQKVRLCLYEKGLEFTDRPVHLPDNEHLRPNYLALNPNGVVPTLRHDGQVITDSSVIMEYLDDVFPQPPLSGRTPRHRAQVRIWLRFFEEVPTVAIRIPSFKQVLLTPMTQGMSTQERRANADIRPLRKSFYHSMANGIDDGRLADALDRLDMTLDRMEATLCTQPWLMGDQFSIVDICVIPTIDRMQDLGYADHWQNRPGVTRWWNAVTTRESYCKTYIKGSRLSEPPA